jgi:hypothetical protein
MGILLTLARGIDRLNDAVYAAIRWLTLAMIVVGALNALARYLTRFTGVALSSNAWFDLQWYMFSIIFLLGAAYGLNHDVMFVAAAAHLHRLPVAFALGGTALLFAAAGVRGGHFDWHLLFAMPERVFGTMSNYVLLAVPFFIFMGTMLEKSRWRRTCWRRSASSSAGCGAGSAWAWCSWARCWPRRPGWWAPR